MKLTQKIIVCAIAITSLLGVTTSISANAADGSVSVNTSSATLNNLTNDSRWGTATFIVFDRATSFQVDIGTNGGVLPGYSSITATLRPNPDGTIPTYSPIYYRFDGVGQLHTGPHYYYPYAWTGTAHY